MVVLTEVSKGRCWSRAHLEKCMGTAQVGQQARGGGLVAQWNIQRHGGRGEREREGIKKEWQMSAAWLLNDRGKQ